MQQYLLTMFIIIDVCILNDPAVEHFDFINPPQDSIRILQLIIIESINQSSDSADESPPTQCKTSKVTLTLRTEDVSMVPSLQDVLCDKSGRIQNGIECKNL